MSSLLAEVIVGLVVAYIALMLILDGVELLKRLVGLLVMAMQWLLRAVCQVFLRFLCWSSGQLRKGGLRVSRLWLSWWPALYQASMTNMKLLWHYLMKGRKDFDSFTDFKNDWNEFRQEQDSSQSEANDFQEPTGSAYAQALEILGLADQPDFTIKELKDQLRKMRAIVHPDKGFPNRVFIQQLNDAFGIVKRERNW